MLIPNTKKAVGEITATTGVFIAKKTYLLRLEDEAGNVCYQYRIKGHPHGAIQGLVNNSAEFEGDVQKLYESAYGGAEYVVDFCCKPLPSQCEPRVCFKTNKNHSVSTVGLSRKFSFKYDTIDPPLRVKLKNAI